jgi:YYY domain-containing protein
MFHDYQLAILYYFAFSLFSIIGLAFTLRFTKRYKFLGYIISKPLGLVIFAYPIWLLASLKIIKFNNQPLLYFLFFIALSLSIFSLIRLEKKNPGTFTKKLFIQILVIELACLLLYCLYLYVKGFNARIEGTERFMDMLLYMSAGKTDHFPFFDPWSPLKPINYYYYGFYLFSLVTRISGVPFAFGYNFSLAIILVCTVSISFAVIYRVSKSIFFSLLGAGLLSFAGNLHYAVCYFKNMHATDLSTVCYYPKATRILEPALTINEFPGYSFVLGDMHPHVMVIPFFLTGIFLLYLISKTKKPNPYLLGSFVIILASTFMVNTWDFITLGFIFGVIILGKAWTHYKKTKHLIDKKSKKHSKTKETRKRDLNWIINLVKENKFVQSFKWWIMWSVIAVSSALVLFLPFLMHFKSPVTSVSFAPEFVIWHDKDLRSGSLFEKIGYYSKLAIYSNLSQNSLDAKCTKDPASTNCKIATLAKNYQYPSSFSFLFGIYGFFVVITLISTYILILRKSKFKKLAFPLLLFATGVLLIIITETIFFGDLFHITNASYFRANTVFKFGYHAWILLNFSFILTLFLVWKSIGKVKSVALGVFSDIALLLFIGGFSYSMFIFPVMGVTQAFGPAMPGGLKPVNAENFKPTQYIEGEKIKKDWTLDGNYYIKAQTPDDWEAIKWINTNQKERVVILEASGGAYTYFGRIGVNTGMANITNWTTHEWTWRFHYPHDIKSWKEFILRQEYLSENESERLQDHLIPNEEKCRDDFKGKNDTDSGYRLPGCWNEEVRLAYESNDIAETKKILEKYKVKYVYIGAQERVTYLKLNEQKFYALGKEVVKTGESRLFEIKD